MPREMASQRPCRRASYFALLLDTSKRIWKTYLSCSPFGEMKSTPAPPPPNFSKPSKYMVQWSDMDGGVGIWFSLHSARKSTRAWDLIAVLGVNFSSSAPSRLPTLRCDQSRLGYVRCLPVGNPWQLISCTRRSNAVTSLKLSVLRREAFELVGIAPLIQRVLH